MRRVPLPYRLLSTVVLLSALLSAGACSASGAATPASSSDSGSAYGPTETAAPSSTATPSATATPSGATQASPGAGHTPGPTLPATQGCPDGIHTGTLTLSEADGSRQFCVAPGTLIDVYLRGTADNKWSAPTPDGTALRPAANGKGALVIGVTAGFFIGDEPGVSHVTAHRAVCPSPSGGGLTCHSLVSFQVTITVR